MGFLQNAANVLIGLLRSFREVTVTFPFEYTGYTQMRNISVLMSGCYDGINNTDFFPKLNPDGSVLETYCNFFVDSVASRLGCKDFSGRNANGICDFVSASSDWSLIPIDRAAFLASVGTFLIACERGDTHGHVNVIVPGVMIRSMHWSMSVPLCANIGKDIFIGKGINWAFREIPAIYAWRPSL